LDESTGPGVAWLLRVRISWPGQVILVCGPNFSGREEPAMRRISFSSYGVQFAVEFGDFFSKEEILSCTPPETKTETFEREAEFSLTAQSSDLILRAPLITVLSFRDRNRALMALRKSVQLYVAEHSTSSVFVHAAVVDWNGRALIFPGSTHAGKSTLTRALLEAGATYSSDEYAVFDSAGRVHPFPIPIQIRLAGRNSRFLVPDRWTRSPIDPGLLVFATYRPQSVWRPESLSPAESMLCLIKHSVSIRKSPDIVLPVLKQVALKCRAFSGVRGETETVIGWLRTLDL
jgi:hypothetical protein